MLLADTKRTQSGHLRTQSGHGNVRANLHNLQSITVIQIIKRTRVKPNVRPNLYNSMAIIYLRIVKRTRLKNWNIFKKLFSENIFKKNLKKHSCPFLYRYLFGLH